MSSRRHPLSAAVARSFVDPSRTRWRSVARSNRSSRRFLSGVRRWSLRGTTRMASPAGSQSISCPGSMPLRCAIALGIVTWSLLVTLALSLLSARKAEVGTPPSRMIAGRSIARLPQTSPLGPPRQVVVELRRPPGRSSLAARLTGPSLGREPRAIVRRSVGGMRTAASRAASVVLAATVLLSCTSATPAPSGKAGGSSSPPGPETPTRSGESVSVAGVPSPGVTPAEGITTEKGIVPGRGLVLPLIGPNRARDVAPARRGVLHFRRYPEHPGWFYVKTLWFAL